MASSRSRRWRQCGFTLVELLIAIALTGLILVILFSGFRIASRSWDAVELRSVRNSELRLVRGFIQRSLRQLHGVSYDSPDGSRQLFSGDRQAIEFVTPMTGYLGLGGLYILRFEYLDHRSGGQLVMTRWLFHPDVLEGVDAVPEWEALHQTSGGFRDYLERSEGDTREVFSQQILLESLDAVEFAYFGTPSDRSSDPEWYDEWDDPQVLPQLVRVSIREASDWWPDILADLSSSQDVAAASVFGRRR